MLKSFTELTGHKNLKNKSMTELGLKFLNLRIVLFTQPNQPYAHP